MSIEKFEEVSNEMRESITPIISRKRSPLVVALLSDKTIFLKEEDAPNQATLNKYYQTARALGYKFNKHKTTINDVVGYLLWFTKRETEAN